ncbi:MAG: hypothetical protein EBQ64_04665 [Acidimicrobiia bacterium]|nr:hypothetical protein [Acidimicrobiia bacterium]
MSYLDIKRRLDAGEIIVLDGATGTELQRRGAQMDPSAWCGPASLNNSELLTQVHLDYMCWCRCDHCKYFRVFAFDAHAGGFC